MKLTEEQIKINRNKSNKLYRENNKDKIKEYRSHYDRKPEVKLKRKEYRIKIKYGITLEEYNNRMSSSNVCESCNESISTARLCYDHDHDTMAFRGVLCSKCNYGIGVLGDNIESVRNALKYLEKVEARD
jgi:RNA polymerase-binding transcription factor DksA